MTLALKDRVRETTTIVGTGTATLLGAATGYQAFSTIGNGNTTYYCISDQGGPNWEVGVGTYTSAGTTLARTTVLSSSNAGALVVFTAGTKDVFVTYPSERAVYGDASNQVTLANQLNLTNASNYNLYASGAGANYLAGSLGIGTTSLAGFNIRVSKTITGTTTASSVNVDGVIQSDVTSESRQYGSYLQTSGVSWTLPSVYHYYTQQGSFGLTTVTNQYGFAAGTSLTGATNNYGFLGNIPAGTGRYNLYMSGTADNYLAGPLITAGLKATSAAAPTLASATTITPTTQIAFVSGVTPIVTITAPSPISLGGGTITLIPTGVFTTTIAGNIALASTAVVGRALTMTYDATTTKWYPSY